MFPLFAVEILHLASRTREQYGSEVKINLLLPIFAATYSRVSVHRTRRIEFGMYLKTITIIVGR